MDKTEKIDILNGANCKVILNGKDIGNYECYKKEEISDGPNLFAQDGTGKEINNIKVVIRKVDKDISQNDKVELVIYKRDGENYYKAEVPDCRLEGYSKEYKDYATPISDLLIEEITKDEYEVINSDVIDWNKIKVPKEKRKDDAFEELCKDIITKIKEPLTGGFHCNSYDGGRDWEWEWSCTDWEDECIKIPTLKVIMQCKYSESCKKITKTEIWEELVKSIEHFPDDYILVTNREMTVSVQDWWSTISEELYKHSKTKYIPFRLHLINRSDLEYLINKYYDIKKKYF